LKGRRPGILASGAANRGGGDDVADGLEWLSRMVS
jgi:hypothetical protein